MIQFVGFVYLSLSFEKHSFVINVATLAGKKDTASNDRGTYVVTTPDKKNDVKSSNLLTPFYSLK